jgi:hypothetical protein
MGSHAMTRLNYRVDPAGYPFNPNAAATNKSQWPVEPLPYDITSHPVFAGQAAQADGNTYQKHPSMASGSDYSFFDETYFVGGNAFSGTSSVITPVAGTTHVWKHDYAGSASYSVGVRFAPKTIPMFAWTYSQALVDSSAPGRILSDSDDYVFCYAYAAGECATGSSAKSMYFSMSTLDAVNGPFCTGGENGTWVQDIYIGSFAAMGVAAMQFKFPAGNDATGAYSYRPLSRTFANYNGNAVLPANDVRRRVGAVFRHHFLHDA